MTNEEDKILEKAKKIIAERRLITDRIETCLTADLCPNCGGPAEPKRRKRENDTYEIYNFRCNQCLALYQKLIQRGGEWTETFS